MSIKTKWKGQSRGRKAGSQTPYPILTHPVPAWDLAHSRLSKQSNKCMDARMNSQSTPQAASNPPAPAVAGAVPWAWGSSQGGAPHCPPAPRSPESPPAGRALPAKQKARSRKGLKYRESSSHQTLHLLHLKNYLASLLRLPHPLPPCTRPAPRGSFSS